MKATVVFFMICNIFFPAQLYNIHFLSSKFVYNKSLDFILQCISIHIFCSTLLIANLTFNFPCNTLISNLVFSLATTCFHSTLLLFLPHPDTQKEFSCQESFHILLPSSQNTCVLSMPLTNFASWLWVGQLLCHFVKVISRASLILYFKCQILLDASPTLFVSNFSFTILACLFSFLSFFYFSLILPFYFCLISFSLLFFYIPNSDVSLTQSGFSSSLLVFHLLLSFQNHFPFL